MNVSKWPKAASPVHPGLPQEAGKPTVGALVYLRAETLRGLPSFRLTGPRGGGSSERVIPRSRGIHVASALHRHKCPTFPNFVNSSGISSVDLAIPVDGGRAHRRDKLTLAAAKMFEAAPPWDPQA